MTYDQNEEKELKKALEDKAKKEKKKKERNLLLLNKINEKLKNSKRNNLSKNEIKEIKIKQEKLKEECIEKSRIFQKEKNNNKNNNIKEENEEDEKEEIIEIKKENEELEKNIEEKSQIFDKKKLEFENKNNEEIEKEIEDKYKNDFNMKLKELNILLNNTLQKSNEKLNNLKSEIKLKTENKKKEEEERKKREEEERKKKEEENKSKEEKINNLPEINQSQEEFSIFNESNFSSIVKLKKNIIIEEDKPEEKPKNIEDKNDTNLSQKNINSSQKKSSVKNEDLPQSQSQPSKKIISEKNNLNSSQKISVSSKNIGPSINSSQKKIIKKIKYTYQCLNLLNLSAYIHEGTEEAELDLNIKNDGPDWPENKAKLVFELTSEAFGDEVKLEPQKKDEVRKYKVKLKDLGKYMEGEYKSYLRFCVNGEKIGEELVLILKVKKKEDPNSEINKYLDQINEFRESFDLPEEDYPNDKLLEALKENNFDFETTFAQFFG